MKKKNFMFVALAMLFVPAFLTSCSDDDDSNAVVNTAIKQTSQLDASNWGMEAWTYVSLADNKIVGTSTDDATDNTFLAANKTNWDIAFHRSELRVNGMENYASGKSLAGNGGVQVLAKTDFAAVTINDTLKTGFEVSRNADYLTAEYNTSGYQKWGTGEYVYDNISGNGGSSVNSYASYHYTNGNSATEASKYNLNNNIFIIRAADGKTFYKLQFTGFTKGNAAGYLSYRYQKL